MMRLARRLYLAAIEAGLGHAEAVAVVRRCLAGRRGGGR